MNDIKRVILKLSGEALSGDKKSGYDDELIMDESRMKAELDEGHPIVVNVGPGDFTDTGHFMVITGYDDEGFSINDPNSIEKSGKRWLFKNISSQIRAVWSMYV